MKSDLQYPKTAIRTTEQSDQSLPINLLTNVVTSPTIEGTTIQTCRDESVRIRTIKFVMDNKEIFDELAKL